MGEQISLKTYYDVQEPVEVRLSPAGDRVAIVTEEFDERTNERRRVLFVAPTDGSRTPSRLSRASEAHTPRWSPDGSKLGFIAERRTDLALQTRHDATDDKERTDADDDELKAQVWLFDLERGGDARQLTSCRDGVIAFAWAPSGDRLILSARDPTEAERQEMRRREEGGPIETRRLQHKFDGHGWLDTVTTYLFVMDIDSGRQHRLDEAYGGGTSQLMYGMAPYWSPNGDRIAFLANQSDAPDDSFVMDIYTIDPDGSGLQKETDSTHLISDLEWGPSGESIAFVGRDPTNWYDPSQVYRLDIADGASRSLTANLDRTIAWPEIIRWVDDESLLTVIGDEGSRRLCCLTDDEVEWLLGGPDADWSVSRFDAQAETVACSLTAPATGVDVFAAPLDELVETGTSGLTQISAFNKSFIADHNLPVARCLSFESDGETIDGLLYHAPDWDPASSDPRPLVLSIHGGPQAYDFPQFKFDYLYWTSRDWLVLAVNYRGSTSYGREFCGALRGNWDDMELNDLEAGVDSVIERGWVDADRLFVTGFSYGGIATAQLITRTDRFAAAAPEHGVYDRRSAFGTDDAHIWWENQYGLPWTDHDIYNEGSAIVAADQITTPTLVTAGENDWRCPPTQAEQLYVSLRKQGVPAELVIYQNEHHDIGAPDRATHRLDRLTSWFETYDA